MAPRGKAFAAPARPAPATRREPAQTIVAALPERNAPLPGVAPRPLIDVGAPAKAALVPGLPAGAAPAAAEPEMALAAVPIPTRRPDYTPEVRMAAAELPETVDLPVSAIAGERAQGSGSDAIAEMLAASGAQARADVVINAPVPSLRPRLGTETAAGTAGVQQVAGRWSCVADAAGGVVGRNACRGAMRHGLDVSLAFPVLRVGRGTAALALDALDVLESEMSIPDAALYLVDPAASLTRDAAARTVAVPLVVNPNFGEDVPRSRAGRRFRLGFSVVW